MVVTDNCISLSPLRFSNSFQKQWQEFARNTSGSQNNNLYYFNKLHPQRLGGEGGNAALRRKYWTLGLICLISLVRRIYMLVRGTYLVW